MSSYDFGNVINCHTTVPFTTNKVAVDPGSVFFECTRPDGTIFAKYTYGVDPQLLRDSVGMYHVLVSPDINQDGDWTYRFWSTVHDNASAQGSFTIIADKLV